MPPESLRILLVDDSPFVHHLLRDLLSTEADLQLVECVKDGASALRALEKHHPDVILLDMELPDMNGLDVLARINQLRPVPVLIFSAFTQNRSTTALKALQLGAVDFLQKPHGDLEHLRSLRQELVRKVRSAALLGRRSQQMRKRGTGPLRPRGSLREADLALLHTTRARVLVLAASTGGPQALQEVLATLPKSFPVPILVVQHMPAHATQALVIRLAQHSPLRVREAHTGDTLQPGTALIIPGDYHGVLDEQGRIFLHQEAPVNSVRPSADVTLNSVARSLSGQVMAVILTGMGQDGLQGVEFLRRAGGRCVAEDESSCVVYGMPRAVIENRLAHGVAPLSEMAAEIIRQLAQWQV
jgi:two-component system chemotaxis response regulator CheB